MRKVFNFILCCTLLTATSVNVSALTYDISAKSLTIGNEGGKRQFYFAVDADWSLSTPQEWLSISPSAGVSGSDILITVNVDANSATDDRNGIITFAAGDITVDIPLKQVNTDNYWKQGDLIPLHVHGDMPAGRKPIPIIVLGNGWDLGDMKKGDGLWERYAKGWSDLFLQQDIFKEMTEYFDIFASCEVSNQRGNIPFTALKAGFGDNRDMTAGLSHATLSLIAENHPNACREVFIDLTNGSTGGYNYIVGNWAGGSAQYVAYGSPEQEQWGQYWWAHEFMGHDFSNMPDYYYHNDGLDWNKELVSYDAIPFGTDREYVRSGLYPQYYTGGGDNVIDALKTLVSSWDNGYWWTTDWESDPTKVIWKPFIGLKGYDNVGVYNGGNLNGVDHYKRPENHNVMNENTGTHCDDGGNVWHDVGSRFWIWNKVLERSGVGSAHLLDPATDPAHPRSLENFIHFDTINNYNANGVRECLYNVPAILTAKEWHDKGYFPSYCKWIAKCTVTTTGGVEKVKDGTTTLTEGVDYVFEKIGGPNNDNFRILRGIGKYSGTQTKKLKTEGVQIKYVGNQHTNGYVPADYNLYAEGETVTVLFEPAIAKDGCVFLGWAKSASATEPEFTADGTKTFTAGTLDETLYAVWSYNSYTVTFDSNGGSAVASVTVKYDSKIGLPVEPTKAGFAFGMWHIDPEFTTTWSFANDKMPARDITLYARWFVQSSDNFINLSIVTPKVKSGTNWIYSGATYKITDGANVVISGETQIKQVQVASGATATVTLDNAKIKRATNISPLEVTGANVTLLLKGDNIIEASTNDTYHHAAIEQAGSGTLTIANADESSTGRLYAKGGRYAAGIGGKGVQDSPNTNKCGDIIINSGIIHAVSETSRGSGIGGGRQSNGGNVTINGGVITAIGVNPGSAIGYGSEGSFGNIEINGGTVYAVASGSPIDNNSTGTLKIGGNAIVFLSGGESFKGTIEETAIVRQKTDVSPNYLNISNTGSSVYIEVDDLIIHPGYTLGIPTNGIMTVSDDIKLINNGTVRASYINSKLQPGGEIFGQIINWQNPEKGRINDWLYSIEKVDVKPTVRVFPNPVGDVLYIDSDQTINNITVSDISGRTVAGITETGSTRSEVATGALSKGVYIVTVVTENGKDVRKVIK
ncbi:MAG: InlB B-repeat-containing protein [Dysgonamonadaceae bacterium]|jgi:hypothetical protein|nr:InlB B-repeat-containing protein [Dysgonamonadaceae bacterium]